MKKNVLVGTFHKTGAVWMQAVFMNIAKSKERKIIFDGQSKFGEVTSLPETEFSCFKVVRNPVDVISSAAKFHSWSKEEWLYCAKDKFSGLTYQEAINQLLTENERYRFEMENSSIGQVRSMAKGWADRYMQYREI